MITRQTVSRRAALKGLGSAGVAVAAFGHRTSNAAEAAAQNPPPVPPSSEARKLIVERVLQAPLIDTHEHLLEEKERLQGASHPRVPCDDWALLFSHYLNSDFLTAGMPKADMDRFLSSKVDPLAKWKLIAPYTKTPDRSFASPRRPRCCGRRIGSTKPPTMNLSTGNRI